jgi:hypothetical protein
VLSMGGCSYDPRNLPPQAQKVYDKACYIVLRTFQGKRVFFNILTEKVALFSKTLSRNLIFCFEVTYIRVRKEWVVASVHDGKRTQGWN